MAVADLILENARVQILDPEGSTAQAVAIASGRILAVGSRAAVRNMAGPSTRHLDLAGKAVVPGFIDAHTHFQKASLARSFSVDFLQLRPSDIAGVLASVRKAADDRPTGAWIRGDGLNVGQLREGRYPTRWELDGVAPDHAIVLIGTGNHAIAANSLALARAGIDRTTEDPPGGRVDRDEAGEPTGVLRELGKLRLDPNLPDSVLPVPSMEDRALAVEKAIRHLHQAGVTCIHDIVMDRAEVASYMRLRQEGRLGVRVRFLVRGYEAKTSIDDVIGLGLEAPFGDEWLQFSGIKLSVDGAVGPGSLNAAIYEPYPAEPENVGLVRIPQDTLDELVRRCHTSGLRLSIHAIGQRAVDMALDSYERAFEASPRGSLRHRIEHAYLPPRPGQLERIAKLGLIVSTQPVFLWDGHGWADIWGLEALDEVMPLRAMLDLGIRVAGGTDYPAVPVEPMPGLASMVTRRSSDGSVLGAAQAIQPIEALRLQTTEAAFAGYDEDLLGSVEVGKAADLAVLSDDPITADPEAMGAITTEMTIVAGRVVFER